MQLLTVDAAIRLLHAFAGLAEAGVRAGCWGVGKLGRKALSMQGPTRRLRTKALRARAKFNPAAGD